MARTPSGTVLALLLVGCFALAPHAAAALEFAPMWALAGWTYDADLGNLDGDPQHELLVHSKTDSRLALLDAVTGSIEQEFPEFKHGDVQTLAENIDGDPRLEIIFARIVFSSGPLGPLTRAYDWTAGGYVTLFQHTEPVTQVSLVHLRSSGQFELLEMASDDVRVRDMNGAVLFRASTAISPWSGVNPSVTLPDLDRDGIPELGVIQRLFASDEQTLFFRYNADFVYTWSATSWSLIGTWNTDADSQAEVVGYNRLDGRYALFDGLSGAPDLELPEFTFNNFSTVFAVDVDGDGRDEIYASRPASPGFTPLVRAYEWVSGNYVQMFSHSEEGLNPSFMGHTRNATQFEFLNATGNDIVIRDAQAGTVLFRASTQIAGWSGSNVFLNPVDLDHDGLLELIVRDNATTRVIRHAAGAYTQLWSSTAWRDPYPATRLDNNPLEGVFAIATSDGHFGLLDPFTGAVRQEFPTFLSSESYTYPVDFDRDGRNELLMVRNGFNVTPLTTCYRLRGSILTQQFSHQDGQNGFVVGPFRPFSSNDLFELGYANGQITDLRIRTFDGTVIWRASNSIPGWTGVGISQNQVTLDVDDDGIWEFLAIDNAAIRLMRYVGPLGVEDRGDGTALRLAGGSPNPFHASTTLSFSTRDAGDVGIAIYDASGRVVRRLDQRLPAGHHEVKWDGRDHAGHAVPSGVLFYEIRAGGMRQSRKLVRLGR